MFPPTRDAVRALRRDREHGAAHLATTALDALAHHIAHAPADTAEELLGSVADAARALARARPSMVPLATSTGTVLHHVRGVDAATVAELREAGAFHVEATRAAVDQARASTVEHVVDLLRDADRAATLSRSGTVLRAIATAGVPTTVLVSDPGGEGRATAANLQAAGVDVTLTPDSHAPHTARGADVVLAGADAVLADGRVRNKTGTHALLLAAADAGVPGIVAADTWKVAPATHEADLEPVEGTPPDGVAWSARRFELVPERVVGAVVTEHGAHPPSQAARWLREDAWAALEGA